MTEEEIERRVENRINAADNALMKGSMTQAEYDEHIKNIDRWAEREYAKVRKS